MNTAELRAIAEAATQGAWECDEDFPKSFVGTVARVGGFIVGPRGRYEGGEYDDFSSDKADAAHIATFNPARIKALLDCVEALEKIIASTHSHVSGRDLLAELHPRNTLDIKRRVDARETWFEGDWLSNVWTETKAARAALEALEAVK